MGRYWHKTENVIMGKGLQLTLLAVSFFCSGAAGYFLEAILIDNNKPVAVIQTSEDHQSAQEIPAQTKSTVPEIRSCTTPVKGSDGSYSFDVEGYVESGDKIEYLLANDTDFSTIVDTNQDGRFEGIPGTEGGTYYVVARNMSTDDKSSPELLEGLKKVVVGHDRLTETEIYKILRRGLEDMPKGTSNRISPSHILTVRNLRPDEKRPMSIKDVYLKIKSETWKDVQICTWDYDDPGRLRNLVIDAVYPE